jgi:hypothetical protein
MLNKLLTCLLAGLVCGFCFFRIGRRFLIDWLPFPVILFIAAGILLTAIVFGVHWAFRRKRPARRSVVGQSSHSAAIMAFWQGAIRYGIAMDLSMIGFQKLFHLQFSTHLGALDLSPAECLCTVLAGFFYQGHRTVCDLFGCDWGRDCRCCAADVVIACASRYSDLRGQARSPIQTAGYTALVPVWRVCGCRPY